MWYSCPGHHLVHCNQHSFIAFLARSCVQDMDVEGSSNPTLTVFPTSSKDTLVRQATISSRLERDSTVLPERAPPPATPFSHNPSPHVLLRASQPQLSRGSDASTAGTRPTNTGSHGQPVSQKATQQGQQPLVARANDVASLQPSSGQQAAARMVLPTAGGGRNGRVVRFGVGQKGAQQFCEFVLCRLNESGRAQQLSTSADTCLAARNCVSAVALVDCPDE